MAPLIHLPARLHCQRRIRQDAGHAGSSRPAHWPRGTPCGCHQQRQQLAVQQCLARAILAAEERQALVPSCSCQGVLGCRHATQLQHQVQAIGRGQQLHLLALVRQQHAQRGATLPHQRQALRFWAVWGVAEGGARAVHAVRAVRQGYIYPCGLGGRGLTFER